MTSGPLPPVASRAAVTKSLRVVVDRDIGAEFETGLGLLIRTDGHNHARSKRLGQQGGRRTNTGRAAMDQHRLSRLKSRAFEHIAPDREVGFGKCTGLDKRHAFGNGQRDGFRHHPPIRRTAAVDQCHDIVAGLEAACSRAGTFHDACQFETEHIGGTGRRWVKALPLHDVRPVDTGGAHLHQQLALTRNRFWSFDNFQRIGSAGGRRHDSTHH